MYDGSGLPAFDPSGLFDAAWLSLAQPAHLVMAVDGPRSDVLDMVDSVYYPVDAAVPASWRGRLAAVRDPLGNITRYESYDAWGNAQRVVDPNGVATQRTFDEAGRVLTATIVANEGCDPVGDPLCTTDLVTTYTYQPGLGNLEIVTSPGGAASVTGYDSYGRVQTSSRGPSIADLRERVEYEYDPITMKRNRESRST